MYSFANSPSRYAGWSSLDGYLSADAAPSNIGQKTLGAASQCRRAPERQITHHLGLDLGHYSRWRLGALRGVSVTGCLTSNCVNA